MQRRIMLNKIYDYLIESELNSDDKTCQVIFVKYAREWKALEEKLRNVWWYLLKMLNIDVYASWLIYIHFSLSSMSIKWNNLFIHTFHSSYQSIKLVWIGKQGQIEMFNAIENIKKKKKKLMVEKYVMFY